MPQLSITAQKFKDDTSRSWHVRSSALKRVKLALDAYANNNNSVKDVADAVRHWFATHPKEFRKRDEKSNGLCTQLVAELGLTGIGTPTLGESAFEVEVTALNLNARPSTSAKYLACGLADFILHDLEPLRANACIVVIDMQSASFGQERYNGRTVAENQADALDAANSLGIDVFEVKIVRRAPEFTTTTNHPTIDPVKSHMPTDGRLVTVEKPYFSTFEDTDFAEELDMRKIQVAVVMGYHADTCVANTIFGKPPVTVKGREAPFVPGLLERGVRVVTSRGVLGSDGSVLGGEYGVRV